MPGHPPPPTRYGFPVVQRQPSAPRAVTPPPPTRYDPAAAKRQAAKQSASPRQSYPHHPQPRDPKAQSEVAQAFWRTAGLGAAGLAVGGLATGGIGYVAVGLGLAGAAVGAYLDWGGASPAAVGPASGRPGGVAPLTNRAFAQDPVGEGGAYGRVKGYSERNVREADHTPPDSTYRGTPYAGVAHNAMPAVSIDYTAHRRGVSGGGGGVTTTGSHATVVEYRLHHIRNHMVAGQFWQAMIVAFNDQKNAAPNSLYYAVGQRKAAEYAAQVGLLANDQELAEVLQVVEKITY